MVTLLTLQRITIIFFIRRDPPAGCRLGLRLLAKIEPRFVANTRILDDRFIYINLEHMHV